MASPTKKKFPLTLRSRMDIASFPEAHRPGVEASLREYEDRRRATWPTDVQACIDPIGANIFTRPVPCGHCAGCRSRR